MHKRIISEIVSIALIFNLSVLAFDFQPVGAWMGGTIFIRSDGSIEPRDAPISTADNITYVLTNNILTDSSGIVVERDNVVIDGADHTLQGSGGIGIYLSNNNVTITDTSITGFSTGISLIECDKQCKILGNNIMGNSNGIYCDLADVYISGNNITNNSVGIGDLYYSYCRITENNIADNNEGIGWLAYTSCWIYHNNFINCGCLDVSYRSSAYFGDYPSGGNYWSSHNGTDLFRGPHQNETGSDGVSDVSHFAFASDSGWPDDRIVNYYDDYPLMHPYPSHDIAIIDIELGKNIVGQNFTAGLTMSVISQGDFEETASIVIFSNGTSTGSVTLPLSIRETIYIPFVWNTTGFAKGSHFIAAFAVPTPGEIDTTDNIFVDGWIIVAMIGDLTGSDGWPDGKCDMRDVALVASKYGLDYLHPRYDLNCDVSGPTRGVADGEIDMRDVALIAKHYGEPYS